VEVVQSSHSEFEANTPESAAALEEQLSKLTKRLGELNPKVQAAVLWHHRDGYTCDEIAVKLAVVTHRVRKYLVKGLAHCRSDAASLAALRGESKDCFNGP
jgi:DNA-directed RNA polymerase specialized sigma24 family protein